MAVALILATACTVRDDILPETYVEANVPTLTGHQRATFTLTSDEAAVTFRCALDDGDFAPCTSPHTTAALADGEHTFWVKAVDVAGNEDDSPASLTWVIDSNLPTLTIAGPAAFTRELHASFDITASKPVQGFDCRIGEAAFAPCEVLSPTSARYAHAAVADGPQELEVQATDAVGFVTSERFAWTVDTTPPVLSAPTKPAALNNQTTIAIAFAANEALQGATCRYDGGPAAPCDDLTYSRSAVGPGNHNVWVQATDLAGNTNTLTVAWTTDLTKPTLVVGHSAGKWTVRASERTKVVATGLNTTIDANVTKTWGTAPAALGSHSISVTGTDMAGNVTVMSYAYCNDNPSGTICDD